MMHVGRGREHPLHVEYMHIGACLAFIHDTMTEALLSHPRLRMDKKIALVKAIGKVLWVQNDLFAKWYVRDGDEFQADVALPLIEEEGYLNGQKVFQNGELDDDAAAAAAAAGGSPSQRNAGAAFIAELDGRKTPTPTSPTSAGVCPFSGVRSGIPIPADHP
jgi:hypothetical protein